MKFLIEKTAIYIFFFIFTIDRNYIKTECITNLKILSFRYFIEILKKGLVGFFQYFTDFISGLNTKIKNS